MRVPESSQRRGSEEVTTRQIDTLMKQAAVTGFFKENFVFDATEIVPVGETRNTTIPLPGSTQERPNEVDVAIRNTGKLNIWALVKYLQSGNIDLDPMGNRDIEPLLKWINATYRQDPASRWVTRPNANAYYDRTRETSMQLQSTAGVLEAIRGIFQTVQIRFGKLTLNVDTATTAFWVPDKNLIELLCALVGLSRNTDIQAWYAQNKAQFTDAAGRIVGMFFHLRHLSEHRNMRKVKLNKFTAGDAFEMEFDQDKGNQMGRTNVYDYYRAKYQVELRYPKLPMADTRDGWLPLELCWSAPGERYKEPLQGAETADFIKFATAPATVRAQQIMENVKKLHWHELTTPQTMGLSVKTKMLEVKARVLPSPIPQYGGGTDRQPPQGGRWNLRGKRLLDAKSFHTWGLLYFPAQKKVDDASLQNFCRTVQRGFIDLGIGASRDLPLFLVGNPQGEIRTIIGELMSKAHSQSGKKLEVLMILIHGASDRLYRAIKHVCDVQFGVVSQVMLVEKAIYGKGQMQYIANIGLKVNVKLGGTNSTISEPFFKKQCCMLMGGDISHPSPSQMRLNPPPPSFSALTASYDRDCTAFSSVASAQVSKTQLIADFAAMAKVLIERYKERNHGETPDSILYFRDGLSEGEFSQILNVEAAPLSKICQELPKPPKLTVVVCVKRHHTRLFPTERGDRLGNVLPGTVVENSTKNDICLQGTVRPTRYAVLMDENKLSADDFQRICNNICWAYGRATTAVSVVPPVYYADQACERAKLHVYEGNSGDKVLGEVHNDLRYTMYWQ
ncbi:MAG: hypothetical protein M1833_004599 [Piccolia ochrophora]|nr:MAG: hypothetical protein M1833_004599 [Piccolia ochrophora]